MTHTYTHVHIFTFFFFAFQVKLYPIKKWQDLFNSVECYLLRYCEEFELDECPLVLSDFVLRQLMRLHRAVNFARYGNTELCRRRHLILEAFPVL